MGTIKQKTLGALLAPMVITGLTACSAMSESFTPNPAVTKTSDPTVTPPAPTPAPTDKPDLLTCLNTIPDYSISPALVNFQMTDSTGGSVGATAGIGGVPVGAQLGLTYDSGKLITSMRTTRPLYGPSPLPDTMGEADVTKVSFNIGLSASIANLSFNDFTQTPLASMSNTAMSTNLQNVVRETTDPWTSQVSTLYTDSQVEIPRGQNSGIQVGDEFALYKVSYEWVGAPCQSNLKIIRPLSNVPYAKVVASSVSTNTTVLTVESIMNGFSIELHDQVVISNLKTTTTSQCTTDWLGNQTCQQVTVPRLALKRSLQLQPTSGDPIPFANGSTIQNVNINPMIDKLLAMLIANPTTTFYIAQ